jgi:hypothetical protein
MKIIIGRINEERIGVDHTGVTVEGAARTDMNRSLTSFHIGIANGECGGERLGPDPNLRSFNRRLVVP